MKLFLLFALLVVMGCKTVNAQSNKMSADRDTIPTSLMIYSTTDSVSSTYVIRGYTVYEDSLLTEYIHAIVMAAPPDTVYKDSIMAFSSYPTEPWIIQYLDNHKHPLNPNIVVWDAKQDRPCDMHPPRGL
jgi:hypothetical protein